MPAPKESVELTVITKAYDLILWSCNHTGKFPRNHRSGRSIAPPSHAARTTTNVGEEPQQPHPLSSPAAR